MTRSKHQSVSLSCQMLHTTVWRGEESKESVKNSVNERAWCVKNVSRCREVTSSTTIHSIMAGFVHHVLFPRLPNHHKTVYVVCLSKESGWTAFFVCFLRSFPNCTFNTAHPSMICWNADKRASLKGKLNIDNRGRCVWLACVSIFGMPFHKRAVGKPSLVSSHPNRDTKQRFVILEFVLIWLGHFIIHYVVDLSWMWTVIIIHSECHHDSEYREARVRILVQTHFWLDGATPLRINFVVSAGSVVSSIFLCVCVSLCLVFPSTPQQS